MTPQTMSEIARPILEGVYRLRNESGQDPSYAFQILPDRKLVDYYKVIKRPMALDIIRKNLKNKKYESLHEFFVDLAQITHNARTYNPPEHFIHSDAIVVDRYIKEQLAKLRKNPKIDPADTQYPDLGPLPYYPSDYDSMDSMDESDNSLMSSTVEVGRRRRPVRQAVLIGRKRRQEDEDDENNTDAPRKRGRPPTVDKPHEHRIKAILRAIRRERDPNGRALHLEFEKLPDPKLLPDYYQEIANPLALDSVRKNIKRRKYTSVDEFLKDINLIFDNALQFNPPDSLIYGDAKHLQQVTAQVAEEELKKSDSAYADPDSSSKHVRVPLDQVQHRGETYKVGDWVHISNPNDPAKPIIGQIFRIWQADGKVWVNACWYYRPEQTVHKYDKLFYENEVVKSGQYRDHTIDEILEKCFVMFITKYQRGRPTGIGNRSVYCCESRYNENEKSFNKIRTWKACIPDEVRAGDYPMDLFERPQQLRRLVSPIKNLLPPDAKDTDPIPDPKMGSPNAPPIVGAVYKRPYDPNDPPEQPTPEQPINGHRSSPSASLLSTPQLMNTSLQAASTDKQTYSAAAGANSSYTYSSRVSYPSYSGYTNGSQSQGPPSIPTAYTLPHHFVSDLPEAELQNVAKNPEGRPLWFPACPIWMSHRYHFEPLSQKIEFNVEGRAPRGLTVAKGLGHSAKYLAWKAKKDEIRL